jgi:hypothetical protein
VNRHHHKQLGQQMTPDVWADPGRPLPRRIRHQLEKLGWTPEHIADVEHARARVAAYLAGGHVTVGNREGE